jgi:Rod binding domain-containing protein
MKINQSAPQTVDMNALERENPELWQAAKGMEANFMKELLRHMRKTVEENEGDANNRGLQIFRGMLDDEYAEKATRVQGIGIAEMIVKQMTDRTTQANQAVEIKDLSATDYIKNAK